MGGISIWQLLIITAIAILLSGTEKLGSIGSDLGTSIKSFKEMMGDDEPKQDKTSWDTDFTAKFITDKQGGVKKKDTKSQDEERA